MGDFLKRRPFFLTHVIWILMLYVELWTWWHINSIEYSTWGAVSCCAAFLSLCILLLVGHRREYFIPINKRIISKFISNSVDGSIHFVILLFIFILQFTWFVDSLYDVFVKSEFCDIVKTVPSAVTMVLLLFIIPNVKVKCDLSNKKLLVTPISGLAERNLELIFYPFVKNVYDSARKDSCQLLDLEKCVIIPSDRVLQAKFDDAVKKSIEAKKNVADSAKNNIAQLLIEKIEVYNSDKHSLNCNICRKNRLGQLGEILGLYLRLFYGRDVDVLVTPPINYDSLDSVFESCRTVLAEHEVNSAETLLYISPGPSSVAGGLCLYGVKRGRHLLYYEQTGLGHLVAFEPDVNDRNLASFIADISDDVDSVQ